MVNDINNINAPQPGKPRNGGSDAVDTSSTARGNAGASPATSSGVSNSDTVELSSQAQELNRIQQELQTLPEIDEARVNDVRQRIASGDFTIDADQIATQILINDQGFDAE